MNLPVMKPKGLARESALHPRALWTPEEAVGAQQGWASHAQKPRQGQGQVVPTDRASPGVPGQRACGGRPSGLGVPSPPCPCGAVGWERPPRRPPAAHTDGLPVARGGRLLPLWVAPIFVTTARLLAAQNEGGASRPRD